MQVGVVSIQRDRAPWLLEWIAFHLMVGVSRVHLYLHACQDDSAALVQALARHYPIAAHVLGDEIERPQLAAYRHAWATYGASVDWMAFLDGDEFLYPTRAATLGEALAPYVAEPISALGVYWQCFGSSGHYHDPSGLMIERFTRHASPDFTGNRHIKTVLRGSEPDVAINGSHRFETPRGTVDERLRPILQGHAAELEPSYDALCIAHYAVQSASFYQRWKRKSGAADCNPHLERPQSWFDTYDRNECDNGWRWRFLSALKRQVVQMREVAGLPPDPHL